jgi:transposase InsO family protein
MKRKRKVKGRTARACPAKGRRFDAATKERALAMVAQGMTHVGIAASVGTTGTSLQRWIKEATARGRMPARLRAREAASAEATKQTKASDEPTAAPRPRSPYAPADPAQGLSDVEVAAILEWKKKHPSMGPAQLRAQLKRFKGWRVSVRAIARVLKGHGYAVVHTKGRPAGPEPIRFEAPRRNALWQADYCQVRVGAERLFVLLMIDDFSRFLVAYAVADAPTTEVATATFRAAMARHGKPEAMRTDRGGHFTAFTKGGDFGRVLEAELVDHIVGRSYSPKGGGKVESAVKTLKRELWECFHFEDRDEAERRLAAFFEEYNFGRAHMGIDGLVPADRFFGRADAVLARIDAVSRKRNAASDHRSDPGGPIEETLPASTGAPLEILRLVIQDGAMELRFCGARVQLGPVRT